jgi:hypothetical protein
VNTCKFSSLAVGRRFRHGGGTYVKISPLLARAEADGASRMIPRSALVETLDTAATETPTPPADPASAALNDYHQAALDCLDSLADSNSPRAIAAAREALSAAHARALRRLNAIR